MSKAVLACLLGFVLVLAGCGNNSNGMSNINGNWSASLTNTDGTQAFNFTTTFTQMSGSNVSVTNLTFTTSSPCFVSGQTETGSFVIAGNFNGSVTGAFQLGVQSGNPSGNTLMLQGTVKNNTITGTWTLTGVTAGCTGSGNFVLTHM
jgi:hypothetical protein